MNKKAIVLLSGGLDSILAAKLMLELGIDIVCVTYHIDFAACTGGSDSAARKAAKLLKVRHEVFDITEEYLEVFKKPKHGYGANVNPCIDCKIFMLKKAKAYMKEVGASFLVTGEVLGERPMSQRRDALNIIEKDAGVKGILLRPLTAKCLEPTLAELEGVVDREKLLDIRGRSRKPQMALAKKYGIDEYPNPAGGCLLTDPGYAKRVTELTLHEGLTVEELKLLGVGRHFRISDKAKLIVGRDEKENDILLALTKKDDVSFELTDREGPYAVLRGNIDNELIKQAAEIVTYHTKFRNENSISVNYWKGDPSKTITISVSPATLEIVDAIRI